MKTDVTALDVPLVNSKPLSWEDVRKWKAIAMEAETRPNTRSTTTKRTPLSNLTNLSLKTPQIPKPYYSNASLKSNNKPPPVLNPSKSDSSIGSSNNVVLTPSSSIRRPPQPFPLTTPPPPPKPKTSSTSSANYDRRDGVEPLVIYSRRQTAKETKKSRVQDAAVPCTEPSLRDPSLDRTEGKEKEISVSLSFTPVEKTRDKGKGILVPFGAHSSANRQDKGKGILVPSSTLSLAKTKDKGKSTAISYRNLERKSMAQSCPPQRSTRNVRIDVPEAVDGLRRVLGTDPRPNKKKRLHSSQEDNVQKFALPQDFIRQQRAYFKEVDDFELLEEEVSNEEEELPDLHE